MGFFPELMWGDVQRRSREYRPWVDERLILDSTDDLADNLQRAIAYVSSL